MSKRESIEPEPRVPGDDDLISVTIPDDASAGANQDVVIWPGDAAQGRPAQPPLS
jgi:hypothetical protein